MKNSVKKLIAFFIIFSTFSVSAHNNQNNFFTNFLKQIENVFFGDSTQPNSQKINI
jgi:hypothetical protein